NQCGLAGVCISCSTGPVVDAISLPMRGRNILAALVLGAGSVAVAAEPPPVCADRPGKATGTCLVPDGHWQIETGLAGWTLQRDGSERDTSLSIGETTIK